jgi:branched-chain amino acid transport system substrate-binding protein
MMRGWRSLLAAAGAAALVAAAITAASSASSRPTGAHVATKSAVNVGIIYSRTGLLSAYGAEYVEGLRLGLDYVTKGTGVVNGHKINLTLEDDAGDPAKAVSAAKDLIGKGYKILAGSTASGVALQVSKLAEQNKVVFVSGPAATDALTGAGKYTFRSGRQTWQDIRTAADFLGDVKGKKVIVFAQDSAFGQANVAAVKAVLGAEGAAVEPLLVPASATDFTPFARKARDARPNLLFVAWAGTTAQAMWTALGQQGVFAATTVATGLDITATWAAYGPVSDKISFLAHYFSGAAGTDVEKAMTERVTKAGGTVDLFTGDGFTAAQMIAHAAEKADDADAMAGSLEGWSFDGVKGKLTVRAQDHALLQPMFEAKLAGGTAPKVELVRTLTPDAVAPPLAATK